MAIVIPLIRYGLFPTVLFGGCGAIIALLGSGAPAWMPWTILAGAIGLMFAAERIVPYQADWNRSHDDVARDLLHGLVNTATNHSGVLLLPMLALAIPASSVWPDDWPFWLQFVMAIIVLDLGVAAAHHASHRWNWLWRFHAVHHSVRRLYGFNGLMKHPVHQAIETGSGILPLLLLGIPLPVAQALAFCVAMQLLLQHSNADYRTGPLKYLFANAEVHRFHHVGRPSDGDVNFGLFTTLWDHLAGTFRYEAGAAPMRSDELGIEAHPDYPAAYLPQLVEPFRGR